MSFPLRIARSPRILKRLSQARNRTLSLATAASRRRAGSRKLADSREPTHAAMSTQPHGSIYSQQAKEYASLWELILAQKIFLLRPCET